MLSARWLIVLALLLEAASLLFGYVARGAITDAAPILMQLPADSWGTATPHEAFRFHDVAFSGSSQLSFVVAAQFIAMLIGFFIIFLFAFLNRTALLGR